MLPESDFERDEIDQISEAIDETLDRIRCRLDHLLFEIRKRMKIFCWSEPKLFNLFAYCIFSCGINQIYTVNSIQYT